MQAILLNLTLTTLVSVLQPLQVTALDPLGLSEVNIWEGPRALSYWGSGAACVTRTRDPRITNAVLYQLS